MGRAKEVIPLSQRGGDVVLIVSFFIMFVIAYTIDIISGIAPTGFHLPNGTNVWGVKIENSFGWPPKFFYESTLAYCALADQVFCHNPMWMKVMALWSPLFYGPFYLFAIYAFVRGRNWIRIPGLMWGWGMFYTVTVILFEEYAGDYPSQDFPIALLANLWWWLFPIVVMFRLRRKNPFSVYTTKKTKIA